MSTVAEKSAARRAKILARSKDRMATVTGGNASMIPSEDALNEENAAAELEKAIAEMNDTPATVTAASTTSTSAAAESSTSSSSSTTAPIVNVPDPHEFLSAADAASFTPPASPPSSGSDSTLAFSAFASAAAQRRRAKEAQILDVPPPPSVPALTAWRRRVASNFSKTPTLRIVAIILVLTLGVATGLDMIEGGGLSILVAIEAMSAAVGFGMEEMEKRRKTTSKSKGASSSSAASSPSRTTASASVPPPPSDDPDVIDLDTDNYRTTPANPAINNPFAAFGLPGLTGGSGGLQMGASGLNLPPGMDSGLQAIQMLMKYAGLMKQLMHDAMIFIFVCAITNAIWQLTTPDRVIYRD